MRFRRMLSGRKSKDERIHELEDDVYALQSAVDSLAEKLGYKICKPLIEWGEPEVVKVAKEDLNEQNTDS